MRGMPGPNERGTTQALDDFNESLRRKPDNVRCLISRAAVLSDMKEFDKALADLKRALELDPTEHEAWYSRGKMYQDRGSYRAAIADYEKAIELGPDVARYRNQLAWLLATCSVDAFRNGPKAVEHALHACEIEEWKEGNTIDTLAAAYAECGNFAEAVGAWPAGGGTGVEGIARRDARKPTAVRGGQAGAGREPLMPATPKPGLKGKDSKKKRRH